MQPARRELLNIKYERIFFRDASNDLLRECAELFSGHYGHWSPSHSKRPGKPIRMSVERLRRYFPGNNAWVATARLDDGTLVGYALAVLFANRTAPVSWVTQLVVHSDYRRQLVGSTMLNSIWGFSNHFAWGIASANPYAIRALEKATRRRCATWAIMRSKKAIMEILAQVPYLCGRPLKLSRIESIINTDFQQDLPDILKSLKNTIPWALGNISEGEEWLAVTFRGQKMLRWTPSELQNFMDMSGAIQREAYERMSAGNPQSHHKWAKPKNAASELDYLLEKIMAAPGARVLDFGCGGGRHSLALAERGYHVTGVDFSQTAIRTARESVENKYLPGSVNFIAGDCRSVELGTCFNIGLCLYDVIGSFSDDESNLQILKNLAKHVMPGGWIILSVMSFEYMLKIAKHTCNAFDIQDKIDVLQASKCMQFSGEIFDPNHVLLDMESHVVYRKEMFDAGNKLPTELIVRDRRYTIDEIKKACVSAGLSVEDCGFVKAGNFAHMIQDDQSPTKEILIIARKSLL